MGPKPTKLSTVTQLRKAVLTKAVEEATVSDLTAILGNHVFARAVIQHRTEIERTYRAHDAAKRKFRLLT